MNPTPTGEKLRFGAYALPSYHAETDPPQGEYLRRLLDRLAWAEELGFDAIWLNEHHFSPWGGLLPSPPLALAALAQRTQRVRLGTSVSVLALHHPIHMAEELAMLDLISGGRLDFGVGRGSAPFDHEVFGLRFSEAQARTLEALEVILQAWRGEPFSLRAAIFRCRGCRSGRDPSSGRTRRCGSRARPAATVFCGPPSMATTC